MLIIILFIFAFTAYTTSEKLGSPGKVYDLLVAAAKAHPVEGNAGGSYLTMNSREGGIFFVINIVGNFGTVSFSSLLAKAKQKITRADMFIRSSVTMVTTTRLLLHLQLMLFLAISWEVSHG